VGKSLTSKQTLPALPRLRLKKNEDRRLRAGHLWVFSNEVDTQTTPLKTLTAGSLAVVEDAREQALGVVYVNPDTLICARLLTRDPRATIDEAFFVRRIETALRWRERWFDQPYYRLIHSESDGLPGLIVDRFGDVLCIQTNTAGMERLQPVLFDALQHSLKPTAVVLKNTSSLRALEGLPEETRVVSGTLPETLEIEENGVHFVIDPLGGQKTGWFFDHRPHRASAARLAKNCRVLDLFCYSGAWGIQAAVAGATAVTAVDSSETALASAARNATLNGVAERITFQQADVFDFLKQARDETYDLIILDPPALIKRKKDLKAGTEAYQRLNQAALNLLRSGGILVSASCSHHLARETLHGLLRQCAHHARRHVLFFEQGGQGPDHPVHPAIPETEYLKVFFCAVAPRL